MNKYLYEWLVYPDSLTKRLLEKAGDAKVTVLAQEWYSVDWSNQWVSIDSSEKIWCREIMMLANGNACWYARSLVPEITYIRCSDFFEQLNVKTLGELIFNSPFVERISLSHYSINVDTIEYQWLPDAIKPFLSPILWVRFSCLKLHKEFPFYLVEILLPEVERYHR